MAIHPEQNTDNNDKRDKDAAGKCVGADTCEATVIADALKDPNKIMENAKQKLDDKVNSGLHTIAASLTNPAKCAAIAVGAFPSMINGIGKSISGQFDNITDSINNTFKAVKHKGFDGFYAPFQIAHAMFLGKIQNIVNNIALGKEADKILADPKMSKKLLFDKIALQSRKYKDALADAEFRGVFKIWLAEYANTLMETLKIAQPEIDRVNREVKNIIEDMGDNIGNSLGHAVTNVITSVVSALPVVGGVVSAIKSADQLGQDLVKSCKPLSEGAGIIMEGVNSFNKEKSRLQCELDKFGKKIDPIMNRIENNVQAGGSSKKNLKKNIKTTRKRVHYLLNRFTAPAKLKTNYTRRLNSRC
jgi:hypothetical protein